LSVQYYGLDKLTLNRVTKSDPLPVNASSGIPFAFETLTIADIAQGLTAAVYGNAIRAFITVETASIRIKIEGGAPTSTEGHLYASGSPIELTSAEAIANFKAIRTDSTSAKIMVTYFE
jgi:hypothetical protein